MATVATLRAPASTTRRGIYEPFHEYHTCWYPVAVAEEIKTGEVRSIKFCDSRIAVFRGEDGVVCAVSARCKQMGAEVGLGRVVGNNVRFPTQQWGCNGQGN